MIAVWCWFFAVSCADGMQPLLEAHTTPTAVADSVLEKREAPPFVMREIFSDSAVFLKDYAGKTLRESWKKKTKHVVVLSYWATWCLPCMAEIPMLTDLSKEFNGQKVKFFLVNTLEEQTVTEDSVRAIYTRRGYSLPCLVDAGNRFSGLYKVRSLPRLFIIDKQGMIRSEIRAFTRKDVDSLRTTIHRLALE